MTDQESSLHSQIADELCTAEDILEAIHDHKVEQRDRGRRSRLQRDTLDAPPQKPGGQVDLEVPLAADEIGTGTDDLYMAPRTLTEKAMAEIWSELLGFERPSINDNFFELGGHSLLAMQALSRIREVFQVELPMRILFMDDFTIAGLAKEVERIQIEQADPDKIAAVLSELEALSDEEVKELLAKAGIR